MLSLKRRQLFKKWKLYDRESFFDTVIIYEQANVVRIERRFPLNDKSINDFIFNTFFEFEWEEWMELTARQIALLLGCTHNYVDNVIKRVQLKIRDRIEEDGIDYRKINQKKKFEYIKDAL